MNIPSCTRRACAVLLFLAISLRGETINGPLPRATDPAPGKSVLRYKPPAVGSAGSIGEVWWQSSVSVTEHRLLTIAVEGVAGRLKCVATNQAPAGFTLDFMAEGSGQHALVHVSPALTR